MFSIPSVDFPSIRISQLALESRHSRQKLPACIRQQIVKCWSDYVVSPYFLDESHHSRYSLCSDLFFLLSSVSRRSLSLIFTSSSFVTYKPQPLQTYRFALESKKSEAPHSGQDCSGIAKKCGPFYGLKPFQTEIPTQMIFLPIAESINSTVSSAVLFCSSKIGLTSTISSERITPASKSISIARCASL